MRRKRRERARIERERKKWQFPNLIGTHISYKNAALEFSKFVSHHIFGLDDAFLREANQVKMNLLRLIHCKEFSSEAQQGMEPSLVLVVPDVICESCQACIDLDICRDSFINQESAVDDPLAGMRVLRGNWRCRQCDE